MDSWHSAPASAASSGSLPDTNPQDSLTTETSTGFGLADFLDGSGFLGLGDPLLDGMPQIEGSESESETQGQGGATRGLDTKEEEKPQLQQEPQEPQEQEAEPVYFGRAALEEMLRAVAALEQEGFVAGAGVQDRLGQTYVLNRVEVTVQPHTGDLALRVIVHDDHTLFAAHPAEILLLPSHTDAKAETEETRVLPEKEKEKEAPAEEAAPKRLLDEDPAVLHSEPSPKRRSTPTPPPPF